MDATLTIAARNDCIDEARRWAAAQAGAAGLRGEALGEVELALTEALANVIEHGYGGESDARIELSSDAAGGALRIRIRDWGRSFDDGAYESPDLDEPAEGGYGVYLIEQLMDDVTREPQPDGGTLLTLTKTTKDVDRG